MIVVGAGVGGILGALVMRHLGKDVCLLEAKSRVGGCAATFIRNGAMYNAGATTLPGFAEGFPLNRLLKTLGLFERVKDAWTPLDVVCEVRFKKGRRLRIFCDPVRTTEELERLFPGKGHLNFLSFVSRAIKDLLTTPLEFSFNGSFASALRVLTKWKILKLLPYLPLAVKPAEAFLRHFYDRIDEDFLDFLSAQTLIVGQVPLSEANALITTLAMGYNFTGVVHAKRGIGGFLEVLAKDLPITFNQPLRRLKLNSKGYCLETEDGALSTKEILLSIPFLENLSLFEDEELLNYFRGFKKFLSPFSAFVVYGKIKKKVASSLGAKHTLIIVGRERLPETSGYIYFSILDHEGENFDTFTASTHTPLALWQGLTKGELSELKQSLEARFVKVLLERLELTSDDIIEYFSATPHTFRRYVGRLSLGGFSARKDVPFWKIPNNITPFRGLYLCCDNAFAGQGFMGISLGCLNFYYHLKKYL